MDEATSIRLGRIRQHGTSAELLVRQILHGLGLRFRVGARDLPGSPDIVNRSKRWAVFVHGCFWHAHRGCPRATVPKRNREFWIAKFSANTQRDRASVAALRRLGFRVVVVWECQVERDSRRVAQDLANRLC
ncbi:very short patch repair endonuclease [Anaeromyxobacter oryzae]|uniref:very short patch repair endonuclease n=1 Tax=Anaeromyxobacter oryzae TaxID=2918170 RepID=UPI0020BF0AF4|nr:very short patch repair endonuclease [Anaeromyxobacter oryzae]